MLLLLTDVDECHEAVGSKLRIMLMEMMKRLKDEEMEWIDRDATLSNPRK